ncbi:hypothetical protein KP509_37G070200 [Ceratopteris richardii]|uniref:Mitochondrial import receptor subunit TOM5 homolog n=1 Tax=Ceratopteris richardii TaxID=49495 RepID=A0A8T2Q9N4_CERRI|nr:hypothetical protein KP509_37G070200 [Ceratopteris richardii]
MAQPGVVQKLKQFLSNELGSGEKFTANMRLLKAVAMFGGGVILIRTFGELLESS